ncbi:hypothetical protein Misp01_24460 [Microtetraspora sp. NBRC 13810]|uniref:hypothetical protein n=1 Tax=Microtetraspora sp. NBRC 13810 TaxID=3030990 RepID=UPI00249FEC39|nr:hypothetical protein [Microtetraspora sp. NBRC 13810]GLW07316.1 hypothetical protein Misp01_24460 [Microtetraspora sp. NBRC 13810]
MMSRGSIRRLTALGAGLAVAATTITGLLAAPAAAASTSKAAPKVSATTPAASTKNYEGKCPATVTFSSKVKVSLKGGKAQVAYRWLHGDGSKSKVKSFTVKGKGTKTVTVKESATFKSDVKGWQALQILSPRKVTTKKAAFSVDCRSTEIIVPPRPVYVQAKAHVSPSDYVGECTPSTKIRAFGSISVSKPTTVRYRWVRNGDVVDYGKTRVYKDKRVYYSFTARDTQRGWVQLQVLSPRHDSSDREYYKVWCKKPEPDAKAFAKVDGPSDYAGSCPVDRTFTGVIGVTRGDTTVKYRWAGPGYRGSVQSEYFSKHGSRYETVSLPVGFKESGTERRWIEILSPNGTTSNSETAKVECKKPEPVKVAITNLAAAADNSTCKDGKSPAIKGSAGIVVSAPTKVVYQWRAGDSVVDTDVITPDSAGTTTINVDVAAVSGETNEGTLSLWILGPGGNKASVGYDYTCPKA